jgi:hypothetical protein
MKKTYVVSFAGHLATRTTERTYQSAGVHINLNNPDRPIWGLSFAGPGLTPKPYGVSPWTVKPVQELRPIVKDAFKVQELEHQFNDVDSINLAEVNEFMSDKYLVAEAKYKLEMALETIDDWDDETKPQMKRDIAQLKRFLKKHEGKETDHQHDGLTWEQINDKVTEARKNDGSI